MYIIVYISAMQKKNIRTQIVKDKEDLRRALEIRRKVFVLEQGVPLALEQDGEEHRCTHFLAYSGATAIGTGRLKPSGNGAVKIERMAVLADWRNQGVGAILLDHMLSHAIAAGYHTAILHAQTPAIPFYQRAGFCREGNIFYEADLPHVKMKQRLQD